MKSSERTITLQATHKGSLGSVSLPFPGLHLVGGGGEWNMENKTGSPFVTLRHQIFVHLTNLRGITNIFLSLGLGF